MKNILITGGAGYIGSILTEKLLNKGYSVTILDTFKWGIIPILHLINNPKLEIINGEKYQALRLGHLESRFDDFDYCKNCDQLLDISESLVWTNLSDRHYGQSRISGIAYVRAGDTEQSP